MTSGLIIPDWPVPSHVHSVIMTKQALPGTAMPDRKTAYRDILMDRLNLPNEPVWLNQTHSNRVIEHADVKTESVIEADAIIARENDQVCLIFTADCLPILITDQTGSCVSLVHAGWRGLANGIIANTLAQLHRPPEQLLVFIGPAIGRKYYEVGLDVYLALTMKHQEASCAFESCENGKYHADLTSIAKMQLTRLGVLPNHIFGGSWCTYSDPTQFHSYRRDGFESGRMASVIWMDGLI